MCKRLKRRYDRRNATLYDCCDEANDFANPTCDMSFCWDIGDDKPFKGDILPISVCYEDQQDKCYQHFMMAKTVTTRVRSSSMCLKTGDHTKPLVCFKQKNCDQMAIDLSDVCETEFETGTSMKAAADKCADTTSADWKKAKKISAGHPDDDCQTEPNTPWGKALQREKQVILGMMCDACLSAHMNHHTLVRHHYLCTHTL